MAQRGGPDHLVGVPAEQVEHVGVASRLRATASRMAAVASAASFSSDACDAAGLPARNSLHMWSFGS